MEIETARLILRPFREEDLDDEFSILGDPETMSFYPRPYTKAEVAGVIAQNIQTYESSGYGLFAAIDKRSGRYVGDCGITIQKIDGEELFEVGYRIHKSFWGMGLAPEAARAMVGYGFGNLGLKELYSYMAKDHHQSRRTAEKAGMTLKKEYRNTRNRGILTTVYSIKNGTNQSVHTTPASAPR
ncbi:GNAT family N-acetyltransferase [Pelagicoccus sp. SDUM812003]|uniref:GNAT family N-acetyltransferase n=1 Tax=Pelagicoccus sp. SDUM812003 TaxID=3041267 RepID=UPI00280D8394|nr:GNAT family N-acetyltransferase [Pelagicoccus sp. SDUM812003]MDQ8202697.1 GNAT family N-acetyltransferase [Pelagicoccus sp. SDUM812003]